MRSSRGQASSDSVATAGARDRCRPCAGSVALQGLHEVSSEGQRGVPLNAREVVRVCGHGHGRNRGTTARLQPQPANEVTRFSRQWKSATITRAGAGPIGAARAPSTMPSTPRRRRIAGARHRKSRLSWWSSTTRRFAAEIRVPEPLRGGTHSNHGTSRARGGQARNYVDTRIPTRRVGRFFPAKDRADGANQRPWRPPWWHGRRARQGACADPTRTAPQFRDATSRARPPPPARSPHRGAGNPGLAKVFERAGSKRTGRTVAMPVTHDGDRSSRPRAMGSAAADSGSISQNHRLGSLEEAT